MLLRSQYGDIYLHHHGLLIWEKIKLMTFINVVKSWKRSFGILLDNRPCFDTFPFACYTSSASCSCSEWWMDVGRHVPSLVWRTRLWQYCYITRSWLSNMPSRYRLDTWKIPLAFWFLYTDYCNWCYRSMPNLPSKRKRHANHAIVCGSLKFNCWYLVWDAGLIVIHVLNDLTYLCWWRYNNWLWTIFYLGILLDKEPWMCWSVKTRVLSLRHWWVCTILLGAMIKVVISVSFQVVVYSKLGVADINENQLTHWILGGFLCFVYVLK